MDTTTQTETKPARSLTAAQAVEAFRKFVALRAAREGIDISGLQIAWATLDATWGDLSGVVFYGCADEVNERVAGCFLAFAGRHMRHGGYEAQNALRAAGVRYLHAYTNGAGGWSKNAKASDFVDLKCPIVKGHAVATTYFPCAE